MSLALDTSVVLRRLVNSPVDQAEAARRFLGSFPGTVAVSDLVVAEAYVALRHHCHIALTQAVTALRALITDPRITPVGHADDVLKAMVFDGAVASRPGVMDRLIYAGYAASGHEVATFDRDLAKLPATRRIA